MIVMPLMDYVGLGQDQIGSRRGCGVNGGLEVIIFPGAALRFDRAEAPWGDNDDTAAAAVQAPSVAIIALGNF